jgi:hypothetical protein
MSAGSLRGFQVDGIAYGVAADANVAKNPTIEKEGLRHSGGNMVKRTLMSGDYEAIKLTITPSEFATLEAQAEAIGFVPVSLVWADGTVFSSPAEVNLGPYQSDDSSCELSAIPESGSWVNFAAS